MREQPLDDGQDPYKASKSVSPHCGSPNVRLKENSRLPQARNNMRESPIKGVSLARRLPALLTLDFRNPALCCNRAPKCRMGIKIFNTCERI